MVNVAMLSLMLFSSSVIHLCYCLPTQKNDAKIEAELKHQSYRLKKIHNDQGSRIAGPIPIMSGVNPCGNGKPVQLTAPTGTIKSPGYDEETYPDDADCRWLITAPSGKVVAVTFDKLSLEPAPDCPYDKVILYAVDISQILGTFCSKRGSTITSTSSSLLVVFRTDQSFNSGLFSLSWTFVPTSEPPPSGLTCGRPVVEPSVSPTRIVGGVEARKHSWPWQCYIHTSGSACGGSIIGDTYILTAAHCLYYEENGKYHRFQDDAITVECGVHDRKVTVLDPAVQTFTRVSTVLHEKYSPDVVDWDIAVIRLATPLTYNDFVQPVCLPSTPIAAGTNCIATGWGRTKGTGSSNVLRQVEQQTASRAYCRDFLYDVNPFIKFTDNEICAGYMDLGKGICNGDSGGPLVCKQGDHWWQYGVNSWVLGDCDVRNSPDFYANVVKLLPWIQEKTGIGASARMNFKDNEQSTGEYTEKSTANVLKRAKSSSTPQDELNNAEKELLDLLHRRSPDD